MVLSDVFEKRLIDKVQLCSKKQTNKITRVPVQCSEKNIRRNPGDSPTAITSLEELLFKCMDSPIPCSACRNGLTMVMDAEVNPKLGA